MQIVVLGRCLEVELKAENGKPSKIQQRNIETIREAGCLGYIIYPEDFPALKKVIMLLKGVSI